MDLSEDIVSTARPGTYSRGTETVDAILKAALSVLIDEVRRLSRFGALPRPAG
jgi:hypothetical protein